MVELEHSDTRALLKLMRDLHEVGPLASTKKRFLLRAMLGITNAKGAVLLEGRVTAGEKRLSPTAVAYEGWDKPADSRVLADYYQTQTPLDPLDPAAAAAIAEGKEFQTFVRHELVGDAEWYGSAHVQTVRKQLGVDDVVLAINRFSDEQHYAVLSLHRTPEAGRFTARERTMLELIHSHTAWLYAAQEENAKTALAPRLKNTLQHLLQGMSVKEIAAKSGLTRNTVHEYVKHIYAYFGVSSRAELMAKVLRGGRQDDRVE